MRLVVLNIMVTDKLFAERSLAARRGGVAGDQLQAVAVPAMTCGRCCSITTTISWITKS